MVCYVCLEIEVFIEFDIWFFCCLYDSELMFILCLFFVFRFCVFLVLVDFFWEVWIGCKYRLR